MLKIKVLGPGCANCQRVEDVAKAAVAELGVEAEIEKVTDRAVFAQYNLLATPGLVINEKLVSGGRIPGQNEVMVWVGKAVAAAV
ncbi:thioredoxin family protein [Promineifilum sp.]|uniref:thioredoxin family protein n=1 Tax=Promineifilum sp. TaxID=2664178 RepID=UPI0035AFB9F7